MNFYDARQAALEAFAAGLSVLPPREDGTKRPDGQWLIYQSQRASIETIELWYGTGDRPVRSGCGIVCGAVSGNLEAFEFDAGGRLYEHFKAMARAMGHGDLIDRLDLGYLERSPSGGFHWLYRCPEISGNTKLASASDGLSLIETRGEHGFIIVAPSNGKVHATGGAYVLLAGGFGTIPEITPGERKVLWDLARMFDETPDRADPWTMKVESIGNTAPWDEFNSTMNWHDLLTERGWTHVFTREGVQHWRRPGKDHSHSATVNHGGTDRLKCFSSSCEFDNAPGVTYSKFGAYAVWEFGGDWRSAIKALKKEAIQEKVKPKPPPEGTPIVVRLDQIDPKEVCWLWPGRVPKGFITIFYGTTGVGKSFVALDIAARLTRGDAWPDSSGECCEPGNVLLISEDPFEYVLAPRLIELGAVMSKVYAMTWAAMQAWAIDDIETLDRAFKESGDPALIVIDPPTNFLGEIDEHKNSEVRAALMQLVIWLDSQSVPVACILITHTNKDVGKGIEAIYRLLGSVAWGSTARIAHALTIDPDNRSRSLFVCSKSNIGEKPKGLAFNLLKTEKLAKVEWLGDWEGSAEEALGGARGKPIPIEAAEWVTERFRERRSWKPEDLKEAAFHDGYSHNSIFKNPVVTSLPIIKKKHFTADGVSYHLWIAKAGWPPQIFKSQKQYESTESTESCNVTPYDIKENQLSGDQHGSPESCENSEQLSTSLWKDPKVDLPLCTKDLRPPFGTFGISGCDEKKSPAIEFLIDALLYGELSSVRLEESAERKGITIAELRAAADHLGVERTLRDGGEFWFLKGRFSRR